MIVFDYSGVICLSKSEQTGDARCEDTALDRLQTERRINPRWHKLCEVSPSLAGRRGRGGQRQAGQPQLSRLHANTTHQRDCGGDYA